MALRELPEMVSYPEPLFTDPELHSPDMGNAWHLLQFLFTRAQGEHLTINATWAEILAAYPRSRDTVRKYLSKLLEKGYVSLETKGRELVITLECKKWLNS